MTIIGLICEYNPFHNGHLYHIKKIKEKYPDSLLILCLNNYFLQRGDISLIDKYDKTTIALKNQIDLVVSLPVIYGSQSADTFAMKAIEILNHLKVQKIIFGSEQNDIKKLTNLATKVQTIEKQTIKESLKQGLSYPKTLSNFLKEEIKPNDLLGISYSKAVQKLKAKIQLEVIKRTNDFNDLTKNETILSAQNIRCKLENNIDITPYLPKISKESLVKIDTQTYFKILKTIILTNDNLNKYLGVTEGIENKLKKEIGKANTLDELINNLTCKRYTKSKIKRMLNHIFLGLKKNDAKEQLRYITILGFNQQGKNYLNKIKKQIQVPLKPIVQTKQYEYDYKAAFLYELITNKKVLQKELKHQPIYIKTDCIKPASNQK